MVFKFGRVRLNEFGDIEERIYIFLIFDNVYLNVMVLLGMGWSLYGERCTTC